jgi:S-adenosylmethionine synthetase
MSSTYIFSSESVSDGHPDKVADLISDTILDSFFTLDPYSKVACETLVADNLVVIAGEFHSTPDVFKQVESELNSLIRRVLRGIGYRPDFPGIDPDSCEIRLQLNQQSPDIRQGVDREHGQVGAGDQGLMFGYATDETESLMPMPLMLAHRLMQQHRACRDENIIPWLRPDAKAQVSMQYRNGEPISVEAIVLSSQHDASIDSDELHRVMEKEIIDPVIPATLRSDTCRLWINPTGRFVIGGPKGDVGLTGRKIIVDTYGGHCPHGGGAFSGKDPTKVDRSAAYMTRYVAKNIVAAGLARRCTVQLAYAIGVAEPVSIHVDFHGTGQYPEHQVIEAIPHVFDLTPDGIIKSLDLRRPIYSKTSNYGHFGRDDEHFNWERTDRVDQLKALLS